MTSRDEADRLLADAIPNMQDIEAQHMDESINEVGRIIGAGIMGMKKSGVPRIERIRVAVELWRRVFNGTMDQE